MLPPDTEQLLERNLRAGRPPDIHRLYETGDDDFAFALPGRCLPLPWQRLASAAPWSAA